MPYALFRLSVVPRMQKSLFTDADGHSDNENIENSKESYLRNSFSKSWEFSHFTKPYIYNHVFVIQEYIGGYVACSSETSIRRGPGTHPTPTPDWPHSNVILNFDHSARHQLIAVETNRRLGRPWPVIRRFVEHINEISPDAQFDIVAVPLADRADYLKAAEEHRGRISEVRFEFVVPNIKFMPSSLRVDLSVGRDEFNAQTMEVAINNKEGNVKADAPRLVELANEADKGIGTITMRWLRKVIFRSDSKIKTVDVTARNSIVDIDERQFKATARETFSKWEP